MSRTEVLDPYNVAALTATLHNLGYEPYYTPETPTTMKLAEDHVRAGGQIPAIFWTDHQTKGMGRGDGRVWLDTPDASILVTGLLKIEKPKVLPIFADMVALHVCRAIRSSAGIDEVRIKYPNDLVIKDKKVGGLLVVNILDGTKYLGTSAGIGINAHYSEEEVAKIPTDYGATALDLHTPQPISRQSLLLAIFDGFQSLGVDATVFQTNRQTRQDTNNSWREYSFLLDRLVQIETDGQVVIRGKVVDTQISRGIYIENSLEKRWFSRVRTNMKVRILD